MREGRSKGDGGGREDKKNERERRKTEMMDGKMSVRFDGRFGVGALKIKSVFTSSLCPPGPEGDRSLHYRCYTTLLA